MNASIVSIIHRFHCTALSKRWIFNQTYGTAFSNGNTQQHNFKCSSQQDMIQIASYIASIPYSRNIGMQINLMFRKINFVLPNLPCQGDLCTTPLVVNKGSELLTALICEVSIIHDWTFQLINNLWAAKKPSLTNIK